MKVTRWILFSSYDYDGAHIPTRAKDMPRDLHNGIAWGRNTRQHSPENASPAKTIRQPTLAQSCANVSGIGTALNQHLVFLVLVCGLISPTNVWSVLLCLILFSGLMYSFQRWASVGVSCPVVYVSYPLFWVDLFIWALSQRLGFFPANTKHLHNIYTTSPQRLWCWSNIV